MKNKFEKIQNTSENIDRACDWENLLFSNTQGTIRLGTTFSGIGAIEHALHRLNINTKIMFAGDIDLNCKKAYLANYNITENQWHSDVREFDAKPYKDQIDLFVGGAPCQAFSLRGKHGGFDDTRGTLFREFARIVIECRPKVFIFENVKGMLSHDKGRTWEIIKRTFENDCGYDVYYQVLNGKDYGIPQSRERLYCIGFKKKTDFKYPAPISLTSNIHDYLEKSFDTKYFLKQKGVNFVTRSINSQKSYTQINGDILLCQKRNQQFNWHGDFIFYPCKKNEESLDGDDLTLFDINDFEESYYANKYQNDSVQIEGKKASVISYDVSEIDYCKGRFRKLTPRECLRLMGFEDSFRIVCSDTETYKQAGNSIIVNVLIALLRKMDITKYAE